MPPPGRFKCLKKTIIIIKTTLLMKTFVKFLFFPALLFLASCSTPQMAVDNQLQSATAMPVKGRQGWMLNQRLSFGEFTTGKVKRGWLKSYDIPFIVRFSGAKEKLAYDLTDGEGNTAEVFAMGKLREQDLLLFNKYFEVNLNWQDAFSGTVSLNEGRQHYDFLLTDLNQNNWFRPAEGFIRYQDGLIDVQPVGRLANGKRFLGQQSLGFQFVYRGEVAGAVETLNHGRVWLKDGLAPELRLVLSSVAAALLLRSELEAGKIDS